MKNLDQTKVGQGLAKVYKGGSKVFEKSRQGIINAANSFSNRTMSPGTVTTKPAVHF